MRCGSRGSRSRECTHEFAHLYAHTHSGTHTPTAAGTHANGFIQPHTFSHTHSNSCVHTQTFHTPMQTLSVYTLVQIIPAHTGTSHWTFTGCIHIKAQIHKAARFAQHAAARPTCLQGPPRRGPRSATQPAASLLPEITERPGRPVLGAHIPCTAHVSLRTHEHTPPAALSLTPPLRAAAGQ